MSTIRTIAVDDEHLALDLLDNFIQQTPGIVLTHRFQSPAEAIPVIQREQPDLLLLDIQMPGLSGLHLLKSLSRPPLTIFSTAYPDHAVTAFALDVVDYWLKPYAYERFLQGVNKVRSRLAPTISLEQQLDPPYIVIKVDGRLVKLPYQDILYVEGMREYVRIHTATAQYMTLERLHSMESQLPQQQFLRIHKSYLVAKSKVKALEGNQLEVGSKWLPISRSKREEVVRELFG